MKRRTGERAQLVLKPGVQLAHAGAPPQQRIDR